jgi:hypothetical protein
VSCHCTTCEQIRNRPSLAGWRERALAAEARVRDLEDTVGELLDVIDMHPAELASLLCWSER